MDKKRKPSSAIYCLPIISALLTMSAETYASCDLEGKVIKVSDGDTVKVIDEKKHTHTIRLANIDAPEKGQDFGQAARRFLNSEINQKKVCIMGDKIDRYDRLIGVIHYNEQDVNLKLVQYGYAWHYKKYQREQTKIDRQRYTEAENNARDSLSGLWSVPNPINPEAWRQGIRKPAVSITTEYRCGDKKFCKQMLSCDEACFHLTQCRVSRLDGNNDGIPCSRLCSEKCP